jgi:hypothetical protein
MNGQMKLSSTYSVNAQSFKASGGQLVSNGILIWIYMIIEAAKRYSHNFMMEIILTGCWSIWEQRHDANFKGIYTYVQRCINR